MSEETRVDEWVGMTKSFERYQVLFANRDAAPVMSYVVQTGKYVMATSADIELAKLFAEHQYSDQDQVGEFKWEPDEHHDVILHLKYKNTRTGEWESTINSITTVPVLR
jgi:hypothetical protein